LPPADLKFGRSLKQLTGEALAEDLRFEASGKMLTTIKQMARSGKHTQTKNGQLWKLAVTKLN
jgi:hypothetical protein